MKPLNSIDGAMLKTGSFLAKLLAKPMSRLGFTATKMNVLRVVVFIPPAAFFFSRGTYLSNLIGLGFCFAHTYFDFMDGQIAVVTGKTSQKNQIFGDWIDPKLDVIASNFLLASIGYGLYHTQPSNLVLGFVLFGLFTHFSVQFIATDFQHKGVYSSRLFLESFHGSKKIGLWDKIVKNFVTLEFLPFLFFGTFRYFLLLAILFNQILFFFIGFSIFNTIRWLVMFWAYGNALSGEDTDSEVVKLLRRFIK